MGSFLILLTTSLKGLAACVMVIKTLTYMLIFRGPDTRLGFTRDLYDALIRNEIKVFFDEEELKKGEEINLALEKAIQVSLMALVIFSINYADSSWCLEELAKVMEYSKDTHMMVVPIFYNVNPSDLHYDKGRYAEALAKHAVRSIEKWKIDRWKLAFQNAADVPGWPIKPGPMYEHKSICNIVEYVSQRIRSMDDGDRSYGQRVS